MSMYFLLFPMQIYFVISNLMRFIAFSSAAKCHHQAPPLSMEAPGALKGAKEWHEFGVICLFVGCEFWPNTSIELAKCNIPCIEWHNLRALTNREGERWTFVDAKCAHIIQSSGTNCPPSLSLFNSPMTGEFGREGM